MPRPRRIFNLSPSESRKVIHELLSSEVTLEQVRSRYKIGFIKILRFYHLHTTPDQRVAARLRKASAKRRRMNCNYETRRPDLTILGEIKRQKMLVGG